MAPTASNDITKVSWLCPLASEAARLQRDREVALGMALATTTMVPAGSMACRRAHADRDRGGRCVGRRAGAKSVSMAHNTSRHTRAVDLPAVACVPCPDADISIDLDYIIAHGHAE
jgi:hypothetical protein